MVRAMYSGVAGLRAHQTRMDVIGNNIANVNTYGYKGSRTTFRDVFYQTLSGASQGTQTRGGVNPMQVGYGAQVASIDLLMGQSGFQPTDNGMDVAIAGQGFIQVQDTAGNVFYSRAGMLGVDNNGNVIDSAGNFVLGAAGANARTAPASSGKIQITVPPIQDNAASDEKPVNLYGTLPQQAKITCLGAGEAGNISIYFTKGIVGTPTQAVFDGTTLTVTLDPEEEFLELDDINKYLVIASGAVGEEAAAGTVGIVDADGNVLAPDAIPGGGFKIEGFDFPVDENKDPKALTGEELVKLGDFKTEDGRSFALQSAKDVSSLSVGSDGVITGNHAVHGTMVLGRIDLAIFNNPEGLNAEGNSYFSQSASSGDPTLCIAGTGGAGALQAGALEMSNVDLSAEFTDMITTQRGFQANARIITVTDEMLNELVNLKR